MAILPGLQGLSASITVQGRDLKEHADPFTAEDESRDQLDLHGTPTTTGHVVKYVEAAPGTSFCFEVTKPRGFRQVAHHVAFRVVLDGNPFGLTHEAAHCIARNDVWHSGATGCNYGNPKEGYRHVDFSFGDLKAGMSNHTHLSTQSSTYELTPSHSGRRRGL